MQEGIWGIFLKKIHRWNECSFFLFERDEFAINFPMNFVDSHELKKLEWKFYKGKLNEKIDLLLE